MSDADIIERLAAAVAERIKPTVPLNIDLWDIATIASYMKRDVTTVRERFACLPDFPPAIRLPSAKGNRAQPLYKATDVIAWTLKYQERRA